MKIILLQDIKSLGRKFDIKNVSDGYARNFLIPKGLVKIATDKSVKELGIQRAAQEKEEQETKIKLGTLAEDLSNREFKFTVKTGKKGEIFGSVNKDDIGKTVLASISNLQFPISGDDIEISLERPIKTLGEHRVKINLGKGKEVKTTIRVIIESA